jgi:hypothetical protein
VREACMGFYRLPATLDVMQSWMVQATGLSLQ